jgi:hypothetical protein
MSTYVCHNNHDFLFIGAIDGSQSGGPWGGMKGFGLGLGKNTFLVMNVSF